MKYKSVESCFIIMKYRTDLFLRGEMMVIGSGWGTAVITSKGPVTSRATPRGALEVTSRELHITRLLMNTRNLVATTQ